MANITITHPEVAKQWHPTKNGDKKPENFTAGMGVKMWWLCQKTDCIVKCPHEWQTAINHRTGGTGCPFCCVPKQKTCIHNSIQYTHPDVYKQWHPTKNGVLLKPEQFTSASNKKIWWLCDKQCKEGCLHEWDTQISSRCKKNPSGCPFCSSNRLQHCIHDSLKYSHPDIASQWHPTKNGNMKPEQFTPGSGKNVWWLCPETCAEGCLHEWKSDIWNRTNGFTCPFCCIPQQQLCKHNSIKYTHPKLASQWHPTKNSHLNIEEIRWGTHAAVWWICDNVLDHEWKAEVKSRAYGRGCRYCVNKTEQKLFDALIKYYPHLTRQIKVEWCKNKTYLPFDFVLETDKIIIELDGPQHFAQISNWQSPDETHANDLYKMKCAKDNGYSMIRLLQTDVFNDTYLWITELRENIEKFKSDPLQQTVYMCKKNEYSIFNNS